MQPQEQLSCTEIMQKTVSDGASSDISYKHTHIHTDRHADDIV